MEEASHGSRAGWHDMISSIAQACTGCPLLLQLAGAALANMLLPADSLLSVLSASADREAVIDR